MMKKIAWNTFKNTGNIKTYLELKQLENLEEKYVSNKKVEANEYCENEGNNNCRE